VLFVFVATGLMGTSAVSLRSRPLSLEPLYALGIQVSVSSLIGLSIQVLLRSPFMILQPLSVYIRYG
jgi:hypothetical protein